PRMLFQVETSEKRAHRFRSHAALPPKIIEDGNDEADEPPATLFGFPKPRLGMLMAVVHRLPQPMHATLGEARLQGNLPDTCLGIISKGVENEAAFSPESHVGRSSAGGLNSWLNLAP